MRNCRRANLGCGGQIGEGWVNIDRALTDAAFAEAEQMECEIVELDMRTAALPFVDDELDYAVCHHVLDLFDPSDAYEFLVECKRVIRPTGLLRVSLADVERAIQAAEEIDDEWFAPLGRQFPNVQAALDVYLRLDGARKMFLTRTLTSHLLLSAGFKPFIVEYRRSIALPLDLGIIDLDTREGESIWLDGVA